MTLTEKNRPSGMVCTGRAGTGQTGAGRTLSRTGKSLSHPLARGSTEATAILARCGTGYRVVTESGAFAGCES